MSARKSITRADWAQFGEIQGYYKARGETLVALTKVEDDVFRVALDSSEPEVVRLIVNEYGNIIDIEKAS